MLRRTAALLQYLGTAMIVLGISKFHAEAIGQYDLTESSRFAWALAYTVALCLAAYGVGLPDLARGRDALRLGASATAAAALVISIASLLLGSALLPRFVVFLSATVLVLWYAACAEVAAGSLSRQSPRFRILAVGSEEEGRALAQDIRGARRPLALASVLSPADAVAGPDQPLVEAATRLEVSLLVLDRSAQAHESILAQAAVLHSQGVRVRTLTLFYDEFLGKLPVGELEQISLMFDIGEIHRLHYVRLKRLLDVAVALPASLVLALAVPFVLAGNVIANRGPLFYRQARVGKNNEAFQILKFRTMTQNADNVEWTAVNDPRVTPFGRWLRRTHLDELPQMINILHGDLSVVGPRPEQPHYVEQLAAKIPFYGYRHLVRPGLTGWAQVSLEYGRTEFDALEKLQYEFYYLRHQRLGLDLRVLLRTLRSVVRLGGE